MDVQFRPATRDDTATLHALTVEGLDSHLGLTQFASCLESVLDGDSLAVWIAESSRSIAGTYSIAIVPTHGARCAPLALVDDVIVGSTFRGRGIGRLMMQHAMDIARRAGCYKLMLSSNLRRTDAHAFYEALGFEQHGYSYVVSIR